MLRNYLKTALRSLINHKNPIGEVITLDDEQGYEVTGIIADQPVNTHLQFDALISFNSLFV